MDDDIDGSQPTEHPAPDRTLLVWGTALAITLGLIAAAFAGGADLFKSNLLFRAMVGGGVFLAAYVALVAFWLARQNKPLKQIPIPGLGSADTGEQQDQENVSAGLDRAEALTKRAETAEDIIDTLKKQLEESNEQLAHLQKENGRLADENSRLKGGLEAIEGKEEYRASRGNQPTSGPGNG